MIEDIVEWKIQVKFIINNRAVGNVPLIAEKISDWLHSEKLQQLF